MWNRLNRSMMFCQMMFGLSFYGVMVILTRFFLEDLGYNEADTMMVVGAFSSVGPLFAIAGGFMVDKFIGAYRALTIAFLGFGLGYGLIVFGASSLNVETCLAGIALASYSRGLMSPSYPGLFKRTFKTDEEFQNGFPINYSINNVGALLGQYLFPLFVMVIGFNGSFMISSVMALIAFIVLFFSQKPMMAIAAEIDKKPVSVQSWISFTVLSVAMIGLVFFMFSNMDTGKYVVYAIGAGAVAYFISLMFKVSQAAALKMGTILIMMVLTVCFFVYYGQMMTSMTMVTINTMRGDLLGFIPLAPEGSMAMNPLWCIVAGPVIAGIFSSLEKRGIFISTATKIAYAFVLTALAFGTLAFAVVNVGADAIIRPEVFLVVHFFYAFGEVIVGSLVIAFILSVTPKHIEAFSVSMFSVAMALSGIIGAVFSTSIALEKGQVINQEIVQNLYGDYFTLLTILAVVMVGVALVASKVIRKMLDKSEELEKSASVEAQIQTQN